MISVYKNSFSSGIIIVSKQTRDGVDKNKLNLQIKYKVICIGLN